MRKSPLYNAIAICLSVSATQAYAIDVPVSVMNFGKTYAATGTLQDNPGDFGLMQSVDLFFYQPWAAAGVAYFEPGLVPTLDNDLATDEANVTNGALPTVFDDPAVNGPFTQSAIDNGDDGSGGRKFTWSGTADQLTSPGGGATFAYNFTLLANEVAWGTLFNWNGNGGIPVLVIMDCVTTPGACVGRGTPMVTAPFPGSAPSFSGAATLSCPNLFSNINVDTTLTVDKVDLTSGCTDPTGAVFVSLIDGTSANGGSIADNGTSITYTPITGLQGPDSFNFTVSDNAFSANAVYDVQVGGELQGNFTIMKADGGTFGGANDVVFNWDQTTFNTNESDNNFNIITISSNTPFFGVNWTAHHIRVYDGGATGRTLTFDVTCTVAQLDAGISNCGGTAAEMMELVIPAGMYGAHINFDWNGNTNIDVVNVWEPGGKWDDPDGIGGANELWQGPQGVTPSRDANWKLASKDVNGDGINGSPMIDGPFPQNYANFSWKPDLAALPPTPITTEIAKTNVPGLSLNLWALLAGLTTLLGLRKSKNN